MSVTVTGITRDIDQLGRITLPIELRRNLNLEIGTPMEILVDGKDIVLRKYESPNVEKIRTTVELEQLLAQIPNEKHQEVLTKAIELLKGDSMKSME